MHGHDIIVIGASAGGIQTLQELVQELPADLAASLFVVIHTSPSSAGVLPQIFNRNSNLLTEYAVDGKPIQKRRIYIAPPDHHLLIKPEQLCVTRGPRENGFRPAVDPLFRTAAIAYGPRVVGVILSGGLDDGSMGLIRVKQQGGIAIVQDPQEAIFPSMPQSAIENVQVDRVLRVSEISKALVELVQTPVSEEAELMASKKSTGADLAELGSEALVTGELPYPPSAFTCPECGGALWEIKDGKLLRYRCHVGHGFTAESLAAEQGNGLDVALWTALRALEESAALRRRMAERARLPAMAGRYLQHASEAEARAGVIRKVLVSEPQDAKRMPQSHPKRSSREKHPGNSNTRSSAERKSPVAR